MSKRTPNSYFYIKGQKTEKFLHDLAVKTFLTDWCYLNPKLPDGKELCDLLVVFDEIAIIWQIKNLKIHKDGRYKKSEVEKNLRQLLGARRELFELKSPIKLVNPRRGEEQFDPTLIKEVYLLSVLFGRGEDMFSFAETLKNNIIHVLNKKITTVLLKELDTISDFILYFKAKEELFQKGKELIIFGGEEELLAYYLMSNRTFAKLEQSDNVLITEGSWGHLQSKPEYKAKKKADEVSYGWDSIINRAHEGSFKYEVVARELARPNRFQRRYLSKVFLDAHIRSHNDKEKDLFRRMLSFEGVTYCFLFQDDPEPRKKRRAMLGTICLIARGRFLENHKVLGIATEKKLRPKCSYDFCLLDFPVWSKKNQEIVEELQKETGIFVNPEIGRVKEDEYPKN
ncbi:MAG: hypothetical protein AAB583_06945 [Patescibacteria group bacterium]